MRPAQGKEARKDRLRRIVQQRGTGRGAGSGPQQSIPWPPPAASAPSGSSDAPAEGKDKKGKKGGRGDARAAEAAQLEEARHANARRITWDGMSPERRAEFVSTGCAMEASEAFEQIGREARMPPPIVEKLLGLIACETVDGLAEAAAVCGAPDPAVLHGLFEAILTVGWVSLESPPEGVTYYPANETGAFYGRSPLASACRSCGASPPYRPMPGCRGEAAYAAGFALFTEFDILPARAPDGKPGSGPAGLPLPSITSPPGNQPRGEPLPGERIVFLRVALAPFECLSSTRRRLHPFPPAGHVFLTWRFRTTDVLKLAAASRSRSGEPLPAEVVLYPSKLELSEPFGVDLEGVQRTEPDWPETKISVRLLLVETEDAVHMRLACVSFEARADVLLRCIVLPSGADLNFDINFCPHPPEPGRPSCRMCSLIRSCLPPQSGEPGVIGGLLQFVEDGGEEERAIFVAHRVDEEAEAFLGSLSLDAVLRPEPRLPVPATRELVEAIRQIPEVEVGEAGESDRGLSSRQAQALPYLAMQATKLLALARSGLSDLHCALAAIELAERAAMAAGAPRVWAVKEKWPIGSLFDFDVDKWGDSDEEFLAEAARAELDASEGSRAQEAERRREVFAGCFVGDAPEYPGLQTLTALDPLLAFRMLPVVDFRRRNAVRLAWIGGRNADMDGGQGSFQGEYLPHIINVVAYLCCTAAAPIEAEIRKKLEPGPLPLRPVVHRTFTVGALRAIRMVLRVVELNWEDLDGYPTRPVMVPFFLLEALAESVPPVDLAEDEDGYEAAVTRAAQAVLRACGEIPTSQRPLAREYVRLLRRYCAASLRVVELQQNCFFLQQRLFRQGAELDFFGHLHDFGHTWLSYVWRRRARELVLKEIDRRVEEQREDAERSRRELEEEENAKQEKERKAAEARRAAAEAAARQAKAAKAPAAPQPPSDGESPPEDAEAAALRSELEALRSRTEAEREAAGRLRAEAANVRQAAASAPPRQGPAPQPDPLEQLRQTLVKAQETQARQGRATGAAEEARKAAHDAVARARREAAEAKSAAAAAAGVRRAGPGGVAAVRLQELEREAERSALEAAAAEKAEADSKGALDVWTGENVGALPEEHIRAMLVHLRSALHAGQAALAALDAAPSRGPPRPAPVVALEAAVPPRLSFPTSAVPAPVTPAGVPSPPSLPAHLPLPPPPPAPAAASPLGPRGVHPPPTPEHAALPSSPPTSPPADSKPPPAPGPARRAPAPPEEAARPPGFPAAKEIDSASPPTPPAAEKPQPSLSPPQQKPQPSHSAPAPPVPEKPPLRPLRVARQLLETLRSKCGRTEAVGFLAGRVLEKSKGRPAVVAVTQAVIPSQGAGREGAGLALDDAGQVRAMEEAERRGERFVGWWRFDPQRPRLALSTLDQHSLAPLQEALPEAVGLLVGTASHAFVRLTERGLRAVRECGGVRHEHGPPGELCEAGAHVELVDGGGAVSGAALDLRAPQRAQGGAAGAPRGR